MQQPFHVILYHKFISKR